MRFFKSIVFFLLLLVFVNFSFATDTASEFKIDVEEFQLKNGMLFLVVERPTTPQVACRLAIRAGSALEETGKTGIAHLLEHMLFKGTRNFRKRSRPRIRWCSPSRARAIPTGS